jgi:hypothetical protein
MPGVISHQLQRRECGVPSDALDKCLGQGHDGPRCISPEIGDLHVGRIAGRAADLKIGAECLVRILRRHGKCHFRRRQWLEQPKRPALRRDCTAEEMRYCRSSAGDPAGPPGGSDVCLCYKPAVGSGRACPLCPDISDIVFGSVAQLDTATVSQTIGPHIRVVLRSPTLKSLQAGRERRWLHL